MQVYRHVNSIFTSNTYILTEKTDDRIYVVDPGFDSNEVSKWLKEHNKKLVGIILTHAHHDHIYGLNDLLEEFPEASIYVTHKMVPSLLSAKANMSEYMEIPFILNSTYLKNIVILNEDNQLSLWKNMSVDVIFTPGHTTDSITFLIDKYVFSGDSLIPGIKNVYRKKSGGNSEENIKSINSIYNTFMEYNVLLPGHGAENTLAKSKKVTEFCSLDYQSGFSEIISIK